MTRIFKAARRTFSTSAVWRGVAQAFDVNGAIACKRLREYRTITVGEAIARDWSAVGGSFRRAVDRSRAVHGWD